MKNFRFLIIILYFVVVSCDDNNVTNPQSNNSIKKLSGKIQDWQSDEKQIKLVPNIPEYFYDHYFGETTVSENGEFDMELNKPVDSIQFPLAGMLVGSLGGFDSLDISDKTIRGFFAILTVFHSEYVISNYKPANNYKVENVGDYKSYIIYSNDYLDITGSMNDEFYDVLSINDYDLHFEPGWNIYSHKFIDYTESNDTKSYRFLHTTEIFEDMNYYRTQQSY